MLIIAFAEFCYWRQTALLCGLLSGTFAYHSPLSAYMAAGRQRCRCLQAGVLIRYRFSHHAAHRSRTDSFAHIMRLLYRVRRGVAVLPRIVCHYLSRFLLLFAWLYRAGASLHLFCSSLRSRAFSANTVATASANWHFGMGGYEQATWFISPALSSYALRRRHSLNVLDSSPAFLPGVRYCARWRAAADRSRQANMRCATRLAPLPYSALFFRLVRWLCASKA